MSHKHRETKWSLYRTQMGFRLLDGMVPLGMLADECGIALDQAYCALVNSRRFEVTPILDSVADYRVRLRERSE